MKEESKVIIENILLTLIHAKFESTMNYDKLGNIIYKDKIKTKEEISRYIREYAKDLQEDEAQVKEYVKQILKNEGQKEEYQKQNNELLEIMQEQNNGDTQGDIEENIERFETK